MYEKDVQFHIRRRDMTRAKPVAQTGATFTTAIARAALHAVAGFWKVLKNRRQVTSLAYLDDRCLKDIGLIRSDIDAALSLPFHRDPSYHLIDVSGHRCLGKAIKSSVTSGNPVEMSRLRRPDALVGPLHLYPK
jgi:uncharacterized protein YjiS (DUF1127 family)